MSPFRGRLYSLPERLPRSRGALIGMVAAAAVVVGLAVIALNRSPGPPTAPGPVTAEASTCTEPCETLAPRVALGWPQPTSGADPTGYRVLRDGSPIAELDAGARSFVDDTVTMDSTYAYQVVAASEDGDSPPTASAEATVPTPPEDAAHLQGVYRVKLTVRSARSIGSAFGIDDPLPGKRGSDRWSFEATCGPDVGACPSTWTGLEGEIVPRGSLFKGTVEGLPARCKGSERAPAPIEVALEAVDVGLDGAAWTVTGFRGAATVAFRCKGFPRASATVEVSGSL